MKAFISGVVAVIVLAVAAGILLNVFGVSTAETFSTTNVRL